MLQYNTPDYTEATKALIEALSELENVTANKVVKANFTSRYVSLDLLLDSIKPVLKRHGFILRQVLVSEEGKVGIQSFFLHVSGATFDAGKLMVKGEGLNPQQVGSALTYIRRQSIQTACGISTDLDDDGSSASRSPATASSAPKAGVTSPKATNGPWYAWMSAVEAERAHQYCVRKKWLPESAQDLLELPADKVDIINGNREQFLKAIK
jgi:hypothetical protein